MPPFLATVEFTVADTVIFLGFVLVVIATGTLMSRKEKGSEGYFLAGRGLRWWLIGFSLIAANISTEHFVGMSGQAAGYLGLAIASYEWMAAITLVVVAFLFLPRFLRMGIYTIPEYLRYRYNEESRTIMATFTMIIYVFVTIAAVIYTGALMIETLFHGYEPLGIPITMVTASWLIGIIAAVYVASGGLKACAWADLIQGSALILGGGVMTYLAFRALGAAPLSDLATSAPADALKGLSDSSGGATKFFALNSDKLHMVLPGTDKILPWTVLVVGLWIPNFYYWGLNQFITQRTLGSKSLAQGQRGVVFAAALKLLIPFVIVFPGIAAYNLTSQDMVERAKADSGIVAVWEEFNARKGRERLQGYVVYNLDKGTKVEEPQRAEEVERYNQRVRRAAEEAGVSVEEKELLGRKYDSGFALLIEQLAPEGLRGFVLAAILGAVVSSLASMLNSASTIFTMDLYRQYMKRGASERNLVSVGRICVGVFVVIGCFIAPMLGDPEFKGIFTYLQEFQGYISPGILAVFLFGILVPRAPGACGIVGLLINPVVYGALMWVVPGWSFLNRMALSFGGVVVIMAVITICNPRPERFRLEVRTEMDLGSSKAALVFGVMVVAITVALYAVFW